MKLVFDREGSSNKYPWISTVGCGCTMLQIMKLIKASCKRGGHPFLDDMEERQFIYKYVYPTKFKSPGW